MDSHVVLATTRIASFEGLTAFSALPDAPVLAARADRSRSLGAAVHSLRSRLATRGVAPEAAAPSRMTACV